jgi:hypothetical protein
MPRVRGATPEQREQARTEIRAQRRDTFYRNLIAKAKTPRQKLAIATDYAKAVGDELDDNGRLDLARAITKATDERSKV